MNINLNQLRCFYLAAKFKSISKAADAMFVSTPAISKQVKKLEEWLGYRLLVREGNSINVTKNAQKILRHAEKIFLEVENLEAQLDLLSNQNKNELIIGAHHIPAKYIMPKLMTELNRLQPHLKIKVVLNTVPLLMEKIQNHDIHFALSTYPPLCPRIKAVPLFTEEMVLVVLHDSKHITKKEISVSEIKNLPLLMPEHNSGVFYIISDYLRNAGIIPCVVMDNLNVDVIKNFILLDMGAAFVLKFAVQDKLDRGELQEISIKEESPVANFNLAYLGTKNLSSNVLDLVSILKKKRFERRQLI